MCYKKKDLENIKPNVWQSSLTDVIVWLVENVTDGRKIHFHSFCYRTELPMSQHNTGIEFITTDRF